MTKEKAKIKYRVAPCNCGCQGADPWHARWFNRVIRDIREQRGETKVTAYQGDNEFQRVGFARFPWGKTQVVELLVTQYSSDYTKKEIVYHGDGTPAVLGWFVVQESFYNAQNDEDPEVLLSRSQRRNPTAWASHMTGPPTELTGPATSLSTSMTEHFLGPMRRNPGDDLIFVDTAQEALMPRGSLRRRPPTRRRPSRRRPPRRSRVPRRRPLRSPRQRSVRRRKYHTIDSVTKMLQAPTDDVVRRGLSILDKQGQSWLSRRDVTPKTWARLKEALTKLKFRENPCYEKQHCRYCRNPLLPLHIVARRTLNKLRSARKGAGFSDFLRRYRRYL